MYFCSTLHIAHCKRLETDVHFTEQQYDTLQHFIILTSDVTARVLQNTCLVYGMILNRH